jgi:hypothetical protein
MNAILLASFPFFSGCVACGHSSTMNIMKLS